MCTDIVSKDEGVVLRLYEIDQQTYFVTCVLTLNCSVLIDCFTSIQPRYCVCGCMDVCDGVCARVCGCTWTCVCTCVRCVCGCMDVYMDVCDVVCASVYNVCVWVYMDVCADVCVCESDTRSCVR